eukprot:Phypoly_transcript_13944.p1 GENE.Phypoly_transcript_13944~~Phypoly_transcript_13944.p1  ORF type:complete len:174 (+),score=15.11 Phypoly_transcript_13944:381-902(+)
MVNFNVSTENRNLTKKETFTGNSCVTGYITPSDGEILRGNVSIDLMSVLTYIGDCKSQSPSGFFSRGLVRANVETCLPTASSFRSFSYFSTKADAVEASMYNNINVSGLSFNVNLVKGPFYKYVQQSYSVSFGAVITITGFAALDVYWLCEATVVWIGYIIFKIQSVVLKIRG